MTGTWVGPGSATRNIIVGQVRGNRLKSGRFRPDNTMVATRLLLRLGFVQIFSGSELVRKQI